MKESITFFLRMELLVVMMAFEEEILFGFLLLYSLVSFLEQLGEFYEAGEPQHLDCTANS